MATTWEAIENALRGFALHGDGYQFWSGIGSGSPILLGVWVLLRRHNCHQPRCWRLAWHPHPDTGHPLCRKHHPHG